VRFKPEVRNSGKFFACEAKCRDVGQSAEVPLDSSQRRRVRWLAQDSRPTSLFDFHSVQQLNYLQRPDPPWVLNNRGRQELNVQNRKSDSIISILDFSAVLRSEEEKTCKFEIGNFEFDI
jgi:hypothetical protein